MERLNRKVKCSLAHLMVGMSEDTKGMLWPYFLPAVQHMLNTTTHGSVGTSPFGAFKGFPPFPGGVQMGIGRQMVLRPYDLN